MSTTTDPVCGMTVSQTDQTPRSSHQGKTYLFCSGACQQRFEEDPGRYTTGNDTAHA